MSLLHVARSRWGAVLLCALLTACGGASVEVSQTPHAAALTSQSAFFDDFNYASAQDEQLRAHGWAVRADRFGPGVPGSWSKELVSFLDDPEQPGNRLMRLRAFTSGSAETTGQAQVYGPFDYFEGTYAARVRFSDQPLSGPGGDRVVQTFFAIADPTLPLDSEYSELDFEYLPNGGWGGHTGPTLYTTSWAAYNAQGLKDTQHTVTRGPLSGWQTLMVTVMSGKVTFSVGERVLAVYQGAYYPDSQMRLAFNHWFMANGLTASGERREYVQDVDWVLHVQDQALTPRDVNERVRQWRAEQRTFQALGD